MREEGGGGKTERRGRVSGNTLLMVFFSFAGEGHTNLQVIETGWTNHQHMTLRMGE